MGETHGILALPLGKGKTHGGGWATSRCEGGSTELHPRPGSSQPALDSKGAVHPGCTIGRTFGESMTTFGYLNYLVYLFGVVSHPINYPFSSDRSPHAQER